MSADPLDSIFEQREPVRKPGWRKALPWAVGAAVVAAVLAALVVEVGNTGKSHATPLPKLQTDVSKVPRTVKLPIGVTEVARKFIQTAVARKNLAQAYPLVTDQIRQGQSLKAWVTGNIAVIPYDVTGATAAPMKIDFSYPTEAQIEVVLLPRGKSKEKSSLFIMDLVKRHGRWLVNSWVPGARPAVPSADSS